MERVLALFRKLRLPGFKKPQSTQSHPQEPSEHVVAAGQPAKIVSEAVETHRADTEERLEFSQQNMVDAEALAEATSRCPEVRPPESEVHLEFDEEWYFSQYPGVAKAVSAGQFPSGLQHYLIHGRKEGRLPVPPKKAS